MFSPSRVVSLIFAFLSMVCWGTWANGIVFAERCGVRFELFYWDYALGIFIWQCIFGLTFGSATLDGNQQSFISDFPGAGLRIFYAFAAGFVFNVANLLLVNGIALAGLAVAIPLGVGIALVEGTILTYVLSPRGTATLLFIGVGLTLIAVIFISVSHHFKDAALSAAARMIEAQRQSLDNTHVVPSEQQNQKEVEVIIEKENDGNTEEVLETPSSSPVAQAKAQRPLLPSDQSQKKETPEVIKEENTEHTKISSKNQRILQFKALGICIVSGILLGLWSPLSAKAMDKDAADKLSAYLCMFWYGLGVVASVIPVNYFLMKRPLTAKSPVFIKEYFAMDWRYHAFGFFSAGLWSAGTTVNLLAGDKVGFAMSYALGQSAPMVASLWGIFFFREFKNAGIRAYAALVGMLAFYSAGIACIALSGS